MTRSRLALAVGLLLGLAFALRVGSAIAAYRVGPTRADIYWDPDSYDRMGMTLLDQGRLLDRQGHPLTDREPGLPLLLAGLHVVLGRSFLVGIGLSVALGVLGCWLVFGLARELFGETAALWALAAACLYPEWIYYCGFIYREPLEIVLLLAWLWVWQRHRKGDKSAAFAWMGVAFGTLTLVRSTYLPLGALFTLFILRAQPRRAWARTAGAFVLCAGLLNGAWVLRNYRITGRVIPGAAMGGRMMYLSLRHDYSRPDEPLEAGLNDPNDAVIQRTRGLPDADAQPYFYQACWSILLHQPGLFWSAFARKVGKLWRPYPSGAWSYGYRFALIRLAGLLSNVPLIALGLAGAALAWTRRLPVGFLVAIPPVMSVIYGLYWSVTRFHTPLMAVVMPLAGFAAAELASRLAQL